MFKYAKILKIESDRVLLGLLNDKGSCGSGSCEGCSCGSKMQTINVKVDEVELEKLDTGMDVKMNLPVGTALDWFLMIFLPVLLVAGVTLLLKDLDEKTRNLAALAAGLAGFALSSMIVRFLRKDQRVKLQTLVEEPEPGTVHLQ